MGLMWDYCGLAVGLRNCCGICHGTCCGIVVILLRDCCVAAVGFLWYCCEIVEDLLRDCCEITMGL